MGKSGGTGVASARERKRRVTRRIGASIVNGVVGTAQAGCSWRLQGWRGPL